MGQSFDLVIVGGGVVGCAVAREIALRQQSSGKRLALLEKEDELACHTSGRNSGVVHSGFNQTPGSLKAKFCVEGNRLLREYSQAEGVALEQCGTLVVATSPEEREILKELLRRGEGNSVPDIRLVDRETLHSLEPNAQGLEALYSPTGSIIDSPGLVNALANDAMKHGVQVLKSAEVKDITKSNQGVGISTTLGRISSRYLINCAGLYSDKIANMFGLASDYEIIPFKGQYYRLSDEKSDLIKSMVYPVPDLEYPFLGVHFTRRIKGGVIVGPNASLASSREGYSFKDFELLEFLGTITYRGFLKALFDREFLKVALGELMTSMSRRRFFERAKKLVSGFGPNDLVKDTSGIRAQLMNRSGKLIDDFLIEWEESSLHVLNAVSPGMTCALPFAKYIIDQAQEKGYLTEFE